MIIQYLEQAVDTEHDIKRIPAQAEVERAESELALSRDNLARAQRLIEEDAVAATEIDRLNAVGLPTIPMARATDTLLIARKKFTSK